MPDFYPINRGRTLVAIRTHDLDKIEGPFTYEVETFKSDKLMELYK
nr:phenylalanine--tRNA ligase beta subunit, cytoplasmic-like [Tanacetum cinerariifolium]